MHRKEFEEIKGRDLQKILKQALNDKGVKELILKIKNEKCKVPPIQCRCCEGPCKGGAWHFTDKKGQSKAIYICDGQKFTKSNMAGYLRHELTHSLQACRGDEDDTCSDRMKMEIEANKNQGKNFKVAFKSSVWSSCVTLRCKPSDIIDWLVQSMKIHYDNLP